MRLAQSVQAQPVWQSRTRELGPAIRETLDAMDANDTAILRARDDLASARAAVPKGIAWAAGGLLLGAGGITLLALAGSAGAAPLAVTAGVVVIAGSVVAGSGRSEIRQAEAALQEKVRKADELKRQFEEGCALERPVNEQSLLKTGRDGLALMRHVESDPYVAVAARRHAHASQVVMRDRTLLQMTRSDRFAATGPRVQEIWRDRADLQGLFGLLGMVGTLWTGFAVSATVGSPYPLLVGLATAAGEWVALRRFGARLVEPAVDRQLKKELNAEIAWHEPDLDALRERQGTTRQSALEHYAALLDGAAPAPPGTVRVEDERVVIGGVAVPRSSEE